jgi:hypothetical protein
MADRRLTGKTAIVTGRVAPGTLGEVSIAVRGGTETYFARPADGKETLLPGAQAVVVGEGAGRTVYITAFDVF